MDCWTNQISRSLIDFIHYSKTYCASRGSMQMLKCLCAFYTIIALGTQFQFYLPFTSSMINKQMGHINCTKYYVIMYNIRHLCYFIIIAIKMGEESPVHCAPMGLDRWCTCVRCRFHMQVKPNHKYKVGNDIKKYFDEHFLSNRAFFFRAKQAIFGHFKSPFKALLDIRLTSNFE